MSSSALVCARAGGVAMKEVSTSDAASSDAAAGAARCRLASRGDFVSIDFAYDVMPF